MKLLVPLARPILLLAALALAGPIAAAPAASSSGIAAILSAPRPSSGDEFLSPDAAFRLGGVATAPDQVRLTWEIADGYYLYRKRVKVASARPDVSVQALQMPPGQIKNDPYLGRQEIYHHELVANVTLARKAGTALVVPVNVTYQGCATAGLCYPPITKTLQIHLASAMGASAAAPVASMRPPGSPPSEQDMYARLAASRNLFWMLGGFFVAGLLVSCTPCVLPMVPILSGIIMAGNASSPGRAFALSLTYVLGMAFTYATAGAVCAAAGAGQEVQAAFQQPWILGLFAALFVALAFSMFGFFTLQMPAAIQSRIAGLSNRQAAGTFGGVAVMGALSALIVTTCVAPALVGALAYISRTGEIGRGAAALFMMALGMGMPVLVVGASQGKLMPKAGPWMNAAKHLAGAMMLGVAAWMLARVVPDRISLILWAVPALAAAGILVSSVRGASVGAWTGRLAGLAVGLYGIALLVGSATGGTDPLSPIPALTARTHELPFRTIKSVADLDRQVAAAHRQGKAVLLDFYADWCTSCKEMEKYTFTSSTVQAALSGTVLLRADVTRNDADDQALLKHFGIFGPPTIAFYGTDGTEETPYRVVGYMGPDAFATRVRQALLAGSGERSPSVPTARTS